MSSSASGLASSIRGATESDTFDLAGQNQTTITNVIHDAFSSPLPAEEMIRLTFITGAGKLGRQKYDENAARAVASTLRSLGYEEDRAASCVVECAGCFKSQHDTGKNLKTIVVFPHITVPDNSNDSDALHSSMGNMDLNNSSKLPNGSPENMIALSSMQVFTRMLNSKCPSWSQKKGCVNAIHSIMEIVQEMENQLGRGQPLSDVDQEVLDSISVDSLSEKEALIKKEMQNHVENGKISRSEKETLLQQVTERIAKIKEEIAVAKEQKKPKKLEKLKTMLEKAQAREKKIEDVTPQPLHRLKHEGDIVKLRVEMAPLLKIENGAKGRLLSMKETKTLARKDEILEEIGELEEKSREWFESDEAFEARLSASRKSSSTAATQRTKKKATTKTAGNLVYKNNLTNWVTPGMVKKQQRKAAPAKKKPTGSGLFAAMMDFDSDSD